MSIKRVLEWGMQRRQFVTVDDEATKGATIGENLYNEDGSLYDSEKIITQITEEVSDSQPSVVSTIWRLILEIPANIVSLAALTGIGFATRINVAGDWANRIITGIGRIEVTNGNGVSGNPIIKLKEANYVAVIATYAIQVDDDTVDATLGTFAETLPTAIGVSGKMYNLKNSGTGVITLNTTLAQTIDGNASGALKLIQYENLQIQSDGANWIIL